jgi:uncharacterized protein (DUF849 family)
VARNKLIKYLDRRVQMDKLIVTVAVTGNLTVPTQTPYLPITPEQIADDSVASAEAGASIVHIHARDPKDGSPTTNLDVMRSILTKVKKRSDAIICPTTGGVSGFTVQQRYAVLNELKPEIASCDVGSLNFAVHPIAERIKDKDWKYSWEKEHLLKTKGWVFTNTFAELEEASQLYKENDVMPEFGIYDTSYLYNLRYLVRRGFFKLPLQMNFVFGVLGGIGGDVGDIVHLRNTADRLFGPSNYHWGTIGLGYPLEFHAAAATIAMGGNVRVGFEDNILISRNVLAKSNAELVEKVVRIAKELGREIATPDEARDILKLKGKDKVNF